MLVMTFFGSRIGKRGWMRAGEHVARVGTVGPLDGRGDEFMELVVVDTPGVCSIASAEGSISDV